MSERLYKNSNIVELESIANQQWSNPSCLTAIAGELTHRRSSRAVRLYRTIENRMTEFGAVQIHAIEESTAVSSQLEFKKRAFQQDRPKRAGYIYFYQAIDHELFKIGRTAKSPQSRIRSATTFCPYELKLLGLFETVDNLEAEKIVHGSLRQYRFGKKKEWFKAPLELIVETMNKFDAVYDVALGNRSYQVIDGKLVLDCKGGTDKITIKTERCPFCGNRHSHGTGGTDYQHYVERIDGIEVIGFRYSHCVERDVELILPNGRRVNNRDGYYLREIA
jgi:hypothetical protein